MRCDISDSGRISQRLSEAGIWLARVIKDEEVKVRCEARLARWCISHQPLTEAIIVIRPESDLTVSSNMYLQLYGIPVGSTLEQDSHFGNCFCH